MGVRAHSQDNKQIPQDGDHVHEEEEAKDDGLQFGNICQSQKKEVRDICLVFTSHVFGNLFEIQTEIKCRDNRYVGRCQKYKFFG